jgi:hypothetical protein
MYCQSFLSDSGTARFALTSANVRCTLRDLQSRFPRRAVSVREPLKNSVGKSVEEFAANPLHRAAPLARFNPNGWQAAARAKPEIVFNEARAWRSGLRRQERTEAAPFSPVHTPIPFASFLRTQLNTQPTL